MRFLFAALIFASLVIPIRHATQADQPGQPSYRPMTVNQYLNRMPYDAQVMYFQGLYDSFKYFASQGDNKDLLECLSDMEVAVSRLTMTDIFKKHLERINDGTHMISALYGMAQELGC